MAKYRNTILADLFGEMRFAPTDKKESELAAAEELLEVIEEGKDYPLDFVVFKLTDYRPRQSDEVLFVSGEDLKSDLRVFIDEWSRSIGLIAEGQKEKVYTTEELAEKLNVSGKTIYRWRKRGLAGRSFLFADGKRRVGFLESSVEKFISENPESAKNAEKFSHLNSEERAGIVKRFCALSKGVKSSRFRIIKKIAGEAGRSVETIRYTLTEYDKRYPEKNIFRRPAGTIKPRDAAVIYKLYGQGSSIKELMEKFDRSRSSIYRIINKRRAKELLGQKIEYIDSAEFSAEGAEKKILGSGLVWLREKISQMSEKRGLLLTREQESELFRQYNYLKYLACLERSRIQRGNPRSGRLHKVEGYMSAAESVKKVIIESNLGLVMSIAGKHGGGSERVGELASEGNISLMRAVEKFDYSKGNRFSTYASWAIAKDFARKIPAEAGRLDRHTGQDMSNVQHDMRMAGGVDMAAVEHDHYNLEHVISNNLSEREQYVIRNHFALGGGVIKKKPKTLKEIGQELGVTKERVRQIELEALQKLRGCLSPEQFDLLTG